MSKTPALQGFPTEIEGFNETNTLLHKFLNRFGFYKYL